jgi:Flp pilus assembly protein TadD
MMNSDNGFRAIQSLVESIAREYRWSGCKPWVPDVLTTVSLVSRLRGLDAALAEYAQMRKSRPALDFQPLQLISFGYSLLRERRTEDAIRVFRLNVELYPKYDDAHDSLGEAYMAAGRTELAVASYRKSLELDPKNDNAVTMLKKLGVDPKP